MEAGERLGNMRSLVLTNRGIEIPSGVLGNGARVVRDLDEFTLALKSNEPFKGYVNLPYALGASKETTIGLWSVRPPVQFYIHRSEINKVLLHSVNYPPDTGLQLVDDYYWVVSGSTFPSHLQLVVQLEGEISEAKEVSRPVDGAVEEIRLSDHPSKDRLKTKIKKVAIRIYPIVQRTLPKTVVTFLLRIWRKL